MDENVRTEKNLYRILQGRLRLRCGGLVLLVKEPCMDLLEASFEAYDEAYDKAYRKGCYIKDELVEILIQHNLWTPLDDRDADNVEKEIEELKIEAFRNFYKPKDLARIKRAIKGKEKKFMNLKTKKQTLDHASCEGVATMTRWNWLLYKSTFFSDGTDYDWSYSIADIVRLYNSARLGSADYRELARYDRWRSLWSAGQNRDILGKPVCQFTRDQAFLCSFTKMYDSVHEHPDSPDERVIDDDICLDGWFLVQKRKRDKDKKQREVDQLITNPKISNSGEVFVMARDNEDAESIHKLNNPLAMQTMRDRNAKIKEGGRIKHTELNDVQVDIQLQRNQQFKERR